MPKVTEHASERQNPDVLDGVARGGNTSADTHRSPMWLRPRLDPGKLVTECISRVWSRLSGDHGVPFGSRVTKLPFCPGPGLWWEKCRIPQQMSVETCLRHLLFLVIPNARNSCFYYEGPECPIHSTQKALQSIQSPRPALAMPGRYRQGTPQSESFQSQDEHGTRSGATYLQIQGWHSEASDDPSFRGSRPI